MEVTVLGYWGAYPWNNEGTSSYLLTSGDFSLLIDAGSHTLNKLREYVDPLSLDSVIISHYHHDHIADLGVLQYNRQLTQKEGQKVLPIYGHTEDDFYFNSLTMPNVSSGVAYYEDKVTEIGPFKIEFLRTRHPVVCFAMRVTEKETGKVLVYTADSGYLASFSEFAKGADLLIADAFFLEGREDNPVHFTAKEVGELAKQANVSKVVLSHLQQNIDLNLLLAQGKQAAGSEISVVLAETGLKINL